MRICQELAQSQSKSMSKCSKQTSVPCLNAHLSKRKPTV
jgi:hypothetical protein